MPISLYQQYLKIKKNKRRQTGAAMALVLMLALLLSISGLTALQVSHAARMRAVNEANVLAARYAADAGIELVLYQMNQSLKAGQWNRDAVPEFNNLPLHGTNALFTTSLTPLSANRYEIISTGQSGDVARRVRVILSPVSLLSMNLAVLTTGKIEFKNNTLIEGFDSSDPWASNLTADIGTLSIADNAIELKNNNIIRGDIYIGPDGDPTKVVLKGNNVTITGEILNHPTLTMLPPVSAPTLTPRGNLSISNNQTVTLTNHQGQYDKIELGNNATLKIQGDSVLTVTGNVELKNNTRITIENGGSLEMYLHGNLEAKNSTGFVNSDKIPSKFKLFGTAASQTIELKNNTDFYGVIYAPNATMEMMNNASIYGSLIVKDFEYKNNGKILYDVKLREASLTDPGAKFAIIHWEDVSEP